MLIALWSVLAFAYLFIGGFIVGVRGRSGEKGLIVFATLWLPIFILVLPVILGEKLFLKWDGERVP